MTPINDFERRMRAVFGIAFAVLFSTIAVSIFVISKLNENGKWIAHTYQVISQINGVHVQYCNVRVSTKNYLLTKQPRHLAPRISGIQEVNNGMSEIRSLTRDNRLQQKQIEDADKAIKGYFNLTAEIIKAVDQNSLDPSKMAPLTDQTEQASVVVAAWMKRLVDEESRLLMARQEASSSFVTQAYGTLPIMLIIQVLVTAYIYQRVIYEKSLSTATAG